MSSRGRRVTSSVGAVVVALGASLVAFDASAQATGFAVDRFNPSERGSDWFEEDSLDMRGNFRPALGIVGEYADRPIVLVNADGTTHTAPVQDQLIVHLGGSLMMADRFRVGLDLPIGVFEDGTAGAVKTTPYAAASGGLGDLRLSGDARLFGTYGGAFTVAAGVAIFVPTGSQSAYLSDGTVRVLPRVAIAGDVGPLAYAAHVGFQVRPLDNAFPGYPIGSDVELGGSVGLRLLDHRLLLGPEIYGSTVVTNGSAIFSERQTPVEGLLGVHYSFADVWRIGGGVGTGFTKGFGEPLVRGTVVLEWAPGYVAPLTDRDHDFIPDSKDACPDVPGVKTDNPRTNGCPPPDRDHDGVPDGVDACPDVPGVKTDDPRTNGCPSDRDHDGIPDSEDQCPDAPGVRMDDKSTNGCPPDSDHDGVPDADDACPGIPGVKTNDPKTNGCPDTDHDNDGIPNAEDACPEVPGPKDADPKRNGCPEAYIQDDQIKVTDRIEFTPAGALLLSDAGTTRGLGAVLELLKAHPEVKHVRVEGHTDNQGNAAANRILSGKRAASVIAWLVKEKIVAGRLSLMGVGGDSPLQDNTTEEGRRANQRIELHVEP